MLIMRENRCREPADSETYSLAMINVSRRNGSTARVANPSATPLFATSASAPRLLTGPSRMRDKGSAARAMHPDIDTTIATGAIPRDINMRNVAIPRAHQSNT